MIVVLLLTGGKALAPKRPKKPWNRSKRPGRAIKERPRAARSENALPRPWYLYVVECADGTLYVGIATDVERRVAVHNSGRGAKYTSRRRPVRLVYSQICRDCGSALRREREIKRWSRPKKIERLGLEGPAKLGKPRRKCA